MENYKTITTSVPENMAAQAPIQIGTRGTVGSLILQEIKYFGELEPRSRENSKRFQPQSSSVASTSGKSKPSAQSAMTTQKKKRKGGGKLLPNICSMVEVSENRHLVGSSGFNYKNLKSDIKKLQT